MLPCFSLVVCFSLLICFWSSCAIFFCASAIALRFGGIIDLTAQVMFCDDYYNFTWKKQRNCVWIICCLISSANRHVSLHLFQFNSAACFRKAYETNIYIYIYIHTLAITILFGIVFGFCMTYYSIALSVFYIFLNLFIISMLERNYF